MRRAGSEDTPRRTFASAILIALLLAMFAVGSTLAPFNCAALNENNSFGAGSVQIQDNDGETAMLSLSGLEPGDTDTACIKVTSTGSLDSSVRLYGTTTGTGLGQYASLTVTRGAYTDPEPAFDSCTNFSADSTTYISGQSAGVIYAGTLEGFPDSWAGGLVDPDSAAPESWAANESHVYKLQVTVGDNATAAGRDATQAFTWEARNL